MALSIKTEEADRLARQLAALAGETMTEAVTRSLRERLERLQSNRKDNKDERSNRLLHTAENIRAKYELEPVSKEEWDALWADDDT